MAVISMETRPDRLQNIHIESYTWNADDLRIFAMLRFYLNVTDKPLKKINEALEEGNAKELILAARDTAIAETAYLNGHCHRLNKFFSDLDHLEISEDLAGRLQRFLVDCREQLSDEEERP